MTFLKEPVIFFLFAGGEGRDFTLTWDLVSNQGWTLMLCIEAQSLNHWTTRNLPCNDFWWPYNKISRTNEIPAHHFLSLWMILIFFNTFHTLPPELLLFLCPPPDIFSFFPPCTSQSLMAFSTSHNSSSQMLFSELSSNYPVWNNILSHLSPHAVSLTFWSIHL